ncbi:DUF6779 domain-containing protein [Nocardia sp. CC201C]|uniref:DUF6779 domain-containing protein n=1 Tax=Nocardia sp. CC201C TaxID=3044575 RepID=UPI0024A8A642|nr:DUF6779 domain-containing protein [Nocardia sp. CC201C]
MVSPSRSSASRRRREDAGKFFTGVLILLGLVASVFLVFSDNVQFVRIGLVAALWAAAIGALAATRYRREAAVDKAKVGDLQKVYHLQLEREVAARREYELGVESRVRQEVGADAAELAALRAELTVLRESLQRLFDGNLDYDRPALRADAVRVQELPGSPATASLGAANDNWEDATPWDPWESRHPVTPVFEPDHPEPPAFASPDDEPVTAETAAVSAADYDQARAEYAAIREQADRAAAFGPAPADDFDPFDDSKNRADAALDPSISGGIDIGVPDIGPAATDLDTAAVSGRFVAVSDAPDGGSDAAGSEDGDGAGSEDGDRTATGVSAPAGAARDTAPNGATRPTAVVAGETASHPTPIGTASTRRRRRADEDSEADSGRRLSVAEIMANLRSEGDR